LAAGLGNGTAAIFVPGQATPMTILDCRATPDFMPVTCMRWRPMAFASATKNVLLTVNAEGRATHWHVTSGKALHTTELEGEAFHCVDYSRDGNFYAIGCKGGNIKVFDETTKSETVSLRMGMGDRMGHSNRVFSVKYIDEHTLISGGWDNNLIMWDLRTARVNQAFYGPQVCADTLDVSGDLILAGGFTVDE
jgi:COMPASS component SWD3